VTTLGSGFLKQVMIAIFDILDVLDGVLDISIDL
jgi:hypothetical protein